METVQSVRQVHGQVRVLLSAGEYIERWGLIVLSNIKNTTFLCILSSAVAVKYLFGVIPHDWVCQICFILIGLAFLSEFGIHIQRQAGA
jgi:hypothetical protein